MAGERRCGYVMIGPLEVELEETPQNSVPSQKVHKKGGGRAVGGAASLGCAKGAACC